MSEINHILKAIELINEEPIEKIQERINYFRRVLEAYEKLLDLRKLIEGKPRSIVIPAQFKEFAQRKDEYPLDPKPLINRQTIAQRIKTLLEKHPDGLRILEIAEIETLKLNTVGATLSQNRNIFENTADHKWKLKGEVNDS